MEPRIGRSIAQGFRAANRSWAGIGVFAVGLTAVTGLVTLGVASTNPPPEVFQERAGTWRFELPELPVQEAQAQEVPVTAAEAEPATEEPTTEGEEGVSLFEQFETAEDETALALPPTLPDAPALDTQEATPAQAEEQARVVGEWVRRAWPVLLLCLLIAIAGSIWLSAGQIGYVAKRVTTPHVPISEFWTAGTRAFLPVLGGALLSLVGLAGIVGIVLLFSMLLAILPDAARAVLGVLFAIALLVGLVWVLVRLAFWFIIIVADRQGPLAALKSSFRSTRGHWWRLAGLGVLMALISYAVWLPFTFLEWLGTVVGGGAALVAFVLIGNLGGFVASLYVGFATLGAYVRFYQDTKPLPASSHPLTP